MITGPIQVNKLFFPSTFSPSTLSLCSPVQCNLTGSESSGGNPAQPSERDPLPGDGQPPGHYPASATADLQTPSESTLNKALSHDTLQATFRNSNLTLNLTAEVYGKLNEHQESGRLLCERE